MCRCFDFNFWKWRRRVVVSKEEQLVDLAWLSL